MSRIRIEDLPMDETLDEADLKRVFGAGLSDNTIESARGLFATDNADEATDPENGLFKRGRREANPFLTDRDASHPLS